MFKEIINRTPLANDMADSFFSNIYGESFTGDVSFISTLRALTAPRMKPGDKIHLSFGDSNYTVEQVHGNSATRIVDAICKFFPSHEEGSIYIHHMRGRMQEDNYACLETIKSTFNEVYTGWHMLEKVTVFYRKQFYVVCFINPDLKSAAIFTDNMDTRKMHYLQCSIFAFLPWYFNPDEGVSELEMSLINSLREKTPTKYEDVLSKIAEQYDFRTARIKKLLAGFETKYERVELVKTRERISDIILEINDLNGRIASYLSSKHSEEIKLLGLEKKIVDASSEDSEIMEYFLCNDKLVLLDVADSKLVFGVKSHIEYFDEDMVISAINNKDSYVYCPNGESYECIIPSESMEKLMRAIFIDQTLKIRFCAAYEFNLDGNVSAKHHYDFGHEFNGYMPNTHIDGYRCMGNYQYTINELLNNRNYIAAIEQCVASNKSLDFGDSTVMKTFMSALYGEGDYSYANKCIELPTGEVVNPNDAIKWLEEQERGGDE